MNFPSDSPQAAPSLVARRPERTLVLSRNAPSPPNSGGNQRVNLLYRAMMPHGEVGFVGIAGIEPDGSIQRYDLAEPFQLAGTVFLGSNAEIQPDTRRGALFRWAANLRVTVRRRTARFKVVPEAQTAMARIVERWSPTTIICRHLDFALCLGLPELARTAGFRLIVDVDDVPWQVWRTERNMRGRLRPDQQVREVLGDLLARRQILRSAASVDAMCVSKPADKRFFRNFDCHLIRNIPFKGFAELPAPGTKLPSRSRRVLMVGSYGYHPNAEAAAWFVRNVWPIVRSRVTDARLNLVGLGAEHELKALLATCDRIKAFSDVPDTSPFYADALVAISPIRIGAGTKVKVLEALAHATPCVATSHSVEGYENEFEALFVADSPAEFAKRCVEVLESPKPAFAKAARDQEKVRNRWSFEAFSAQVAAAALASR